MSPLVGRDVKRTLLSMAVPMLAGTFAMNAYNLTDTWFVSRLGTGPLAAMGFTFPVVMLLNCVARGLGSGITTLVSHALGRKDEADARRLVLHGFVIAAVVMLALSVLGALSIDLVFRALGARDELLELVRGYMGIWYAGTIFMAVPMVGHGLLISAGDARAASRYMMLGTLLNLLLDPIMIFGLLAFPAMGVKGASLATVVARMVSSSFVLRCLVRKHGLLGLSDPGWHHFPASLRRISRFAVPAILSMSLMPISAAVITRLLARFGAEPVAATAAAQRLEMFAFMVPMALGISLTPFMSQNFGAGRLDRVREAFRTSTLFALIYGAATTLVFQLAAPLFARLFTEDPVVTGHLVTYVRLVSFGYGLMETHRYCGFVLTGMQHPLQSTLLNVLRVVLLLVPLSLLGAHLHGVRGVFEGRLVTDVVVGVIGIEWVRRTLAAAGRDRGEALSAP